MARGWGAGAVILVACSSTGGTGDAGIDGATMVADGSADGSADGPGGDGGESGVGPDATGTDTGADACKETGSVRCSSCAQTCGPPSSNTTLLRCNGDGGKSSLDLYTAFYDCLCGQNGTSGKCGPVCSKTCLGTGTDSGSCMTCLASAVAGACNAAYTGCKNDT